MANTILHAGQSRILYDMFIAKTVRHAICITSRGWGKSFFAGSAASAAAFELMQLSRRVPNKNVYIIAPTYSQVTDIYYPLLYDHLGLSQYALKSSRDAGRFWFPGNVEIQLVSYEAAERLRGSGAYFIVMDEVSSWTKGIGHKQTWQGILEPCITTRWSEKRAFILGAPSPGRSLTISTPLGYNYLDELSYLEELDPEYKTYRYDYTTSPYLDPKEIEKKRHTLDPITFAREYLAQAKESGNSVFYCFDRKAHVDGSIAMPEPWEDIHVGIDFNIGVQASSAFVIRGGQVFYIDEFMGFNDTEQLSAAINGRYRSKPTDERKRKIYVYPDPTGKSRKTSATTGTTDFSILAANGLIVMAHNASPKIVDSVACVNRMLKTAAGEINLRIHPKCQEIIKSIERTAWVDNNSDSATIDKKDGIEHMSDGVRYAMEYLFPIHTGKKIVTRGFGF